MKHIVFFLLLFVVGGCSKQEAGKDGHQEQDGPTLSEISPTSIEMGDEVLIFGSGFGTSVGDVMVLFDGSSANVLTVQDNLISAVSPRHLCGDAEVKVFIRSNKINKTLSVHYTKGTDGYEYKNQIPDVKKLLLACPAFSKITRFDTTRLWRSVHESIISAELPATTKDKEQKIDVVKLNIYILVADLKDKNISPKLTLPDNEIKKGYWAKQTLTNMVKSIPTSEGNVIGITNGDFWNTEITVPKGPTHFRGTIVSDQWETSKILSEQGLTFVGISKNRNVVMDYKDNYIAAKDTLVDLCGGGRMLVFEGKTLWTNPKTGIVRDPRTAIAYSKDGLFILMTVDGRDSGVSEGANYHEMADIFVSLGCETALNLDGGGSAQFMTRNPQTGIYSIKNKPTDGQERPVVNGWAIISGVNN